MELCKVTQIAAMAETIAYNIIVYVVKATTQPTTEADILKHTCDFIIYKLERGIQSHRGDLETSVPILLTYFWKRQCFIISTHSHKEAYADSFIHSLIHPLTQWFIDCFSHLFNKLLSTETFYVSNTGNSRADNIDTVFAIFAIMRDLMKLWWRSVYRVFIWWEKVMLKQEKGCAFFSPYSIINKWYVIICFHFSHKWSF